MNDLILRSDTGHIAHLTLNSPANFNALSLEMIDRMTQVLTDIATDPDVRVVVIAGTGKAFSAGHDLRQMQGARGNKDGGRAAYQDLFDRCAHMMQLITALPQPVIAQVHGIATAAGCQLVASCDLGVAAEGTRFGVNGVNIGLFCSTPMVALARAVPPKAAFEMLATGEFIDAGRARDLGLINRVVPAEELAQATSELAETLAAKLPAALQIGKQAFRRQIGQSLADAYGSAGALMCENIMLPETDEGITAFLEKRKPNWA